MKLYVLKIIIILLVIIDGCADRSLFTEPGIDPGLGGIYTKISGEISGTLLKNKSPYLVTNNITVKESTILNIEAGTQIFFKEKTSLYIDGGLRALGTKEYPIVFRAFEFGWEGIHSYDPTDSLIFLFCSIEEVYLPQDNPLKYGAIETTNTNLQIKNCYFVDNYTQFGGALALFASSSEITNNIFYRNESVVYGGAILSQNSSNNIINNTFYKNYCLNFGGGLVLVDPVSEEIQNNIFFDNFSYLGDPRIELVSGDSTNVFEQYNFLAFGDMNPLFKSATDFHLQENSPCKNAGNPEPEFNDSDGSRNDHGAYGGASGDW
jgi:hypothetical protein